MAEGCVFAHIDSELLPVLEELRRAEPLFHTHESGSSPADYKRITSPDYWEVGASGRRYSRDFILRELSKTPPVLASTAGWRSWDHAVRGLGPTTYLFTYVLEQGKRLTRRSTIWERTDEGWRALYHQGTVVSAEEDDVAPQ